MQTSTVRHEGEMMMSDWDQVEALLPPQWEAKARELGALKRVRSIANANTLLRVMFIHIAQGSGLRETAELARLSGIAQLSDVAILKRLRGCGAWFEWMCHELRAAWQPKSLAPEIGSCWAGRRIRLIDGTMVSEPGVTGSKWRLHYSVDLPSLRADEVILSGQSDGETLRRFTIKEGDILVADRGFANAAGVAHVDSGGGTVVVRMNLVTLPLYDDQKMRLDVLERARTLEIGQCASWQVNVLHKKRNISGRLCVVKKTLEASKKARERVRRESLRNGTVLRVDTLEAADYIFVFTTLGEEIAARDVLELYRARWQIELVFKRLKSLADLGHLKKHDPDAARAWLQGKMLVALLIDALLATAEHFSPWGCRKLK